MAAGTKVGEAWVELQLNIAKFESKLKSAEVMTGKSVGTMQAKFQALAPTFRKVGIGMAVAGGIITGALTACIMKSVAFGDQLDKMSKRTGVSVESLSALKYAADLSGASIETVENSLRFMARAMDDVSKGTGEALETFKKLGISVSDTQGNLRPTVEVMKEVATKIAAMTNETQRVAAATDIFGSRYGTQLLPLLMEGSKGIENLMNKAKDLGIVMSTEAATKAAEFNDRLDELKASIGMVAVKIGTSLLPVIKPLIENVRDIAGRMSKWIEENPKLAATLTKVALGVGAFLAVAGPILIFLPKIIALIPALITGLGAIKGAIIAMHVAIGPIGWAIEAIIAAIVLLYVAWTKNWGGIQEKTRAVVNFISKYFIKFVNFMSQNVLNPIITGFEWMANKILGVVGNMIGSLIDLISYLPNSLLKVFGTSQEEVKTFAVGVREMFQIELGRIPKIAEDALTWRMPEKTKEGLKEDFDEIAETQEGWVTRSLDDFSAWVDGLEAMGESAEETSEKVKKAWEEMEEPEQKRLKAAMQMLDVGIQLGLTLEQIGIKQADAIEVIAMASEGYLSVTQETMEKFKTLVLKSVEEIGPQMGAEGEKLAEAFLYGTSPGGFVSTVVEAAGKVIDGIIEKMIGNVMAIAETGKEVAETFVESLTQEIDRGLKYTIKGLEDSLREVSRAGEEIRETLEGLVTAGAEVGKEFARGVTEEISTGLKYTLGSVKDGLGEIVKSSADIGRTFTDIISGIKDDLKGLADSTVEVGQKVKEGIQSINSELQRVAESSSEIGAAFRYILRGVKDSLQEVADVSMGMGQGLRDVASGFNESLQEVIGSVAGIKEELLGIMESIKDGLENAVDKTSKVGDNLKDTAQDISSTFQALGGAHGFEEEHKAYEAAVEAGQSTLGIWYGMEQWRKAVGGGIQNFQYGGIAKETGLAHVVKGERMIPPGKSVGAASKSSSIFNFNINFGQGSNFAQFEKHEVRRFFYDQIYPLVLEANQRKT